MKLIQDKFRKNRGGSSRFLDILCHKCDHHLFYYQKDGPGIIKRLYLDRIHPDVKKADSLICPKCKDILGVLILYKKENRPAYKLFVGSIQKRLVSAENVK